MRLVILSISLFFIIILIILLNTVIISSLNSQTGICMTEKCNTLSEKLLKAIDSNVNPCENFYNYVCGNFMKETTIPEDKNGIHSYSSTIDKVKSQLKTILEEPSNVGETKSLVLLKQAYKSCMNITKLNRESLSYLSRFMKEMGGWPVIDPNWNEKKFDWKHFLYRLRRNKWDVSIFLRLKIEKNPINSSTRILTIDEPSMRNYHALRRGFQDPETQAYYEYMRRIVGLLGGDQLSAAFEMKEVVDFEISLTHIMIPVSAATFNPKTIKGLQEEVPGIPWLQIINNFLAPFEVLKSSDIVNVLALRYVKKLEDVLGHTKKRILANYMFWNIFSGIVGHLPEKFRNEELRYLKAVKGVSPFPFRSTRCLKDMDKLNLALSLIYAQRHFNPEIKKDVDVIGKHIIQAFIEKLQRNQWLDPETKTLAIRKTKKIKFQIGYPINEQIIDAYYDQLELKDDQNYLKVYLNTTYFLHEKQVKNLKKLVNRDDWTDFQTYEVNALYDQNINSIILMTALLQDPFFGAQSPHFVNFASIGEIMSHEILHAFDNEGKQFDPEGNLKNWWQPETSNFFKNKTDCFVKQYGNFTIPEKNITLNGLRTLNENLADNGGITTIYEAYVNWVEQNGEEGTLPELPYTTKQLFWILFGSNNCGKYREKFLEKIAFAGSHSPSAARVLIPLMNSERFSEDFVCEKGSPMNPEEKCEVW